MTLDEVLQQLRERFAKLSAELRLNYSQGSDRARDNLRIEIERLESAKYTGQVPEDALLRSIWQWNIEQETWHSQAQLNAAFRRFDERGRRILQDIEAIEPCRSYREQEWPDAYENPALFSTIERDRRLPHDDSSELFSAVNSLLPLMCVRSTLRRRLREVDCDR